MSWSGIPKTNSKVESSRLAFAFWSQGRRCRPFPGGIRWDLNSGEKTDFWELCSGSCPGLEWSLPQSWPCRGMYECHKHVHTLYNLHRSTWQPLSLEIQLLELVHHNLQPWASALRAITIQTPGKCFSLLPPSHPGNASHFLQVCGCVAAVTRVRLGGIGAGEVLKWQKRQISVSTLFLKKPECSKFCHNTVQFFRNATYLSIFIIFWLLFLVQLVVLEVYSELIWYWQLLCIMNGEYFAILDILHYSNLYICSSRLIELLI